MGWYKANPGSGSGFTDSLCDVLPRMQMLGIAAPAKAVLVLKFAIFVVIHDDRDKGVGL